MPKTKSKPSKENKLSLSIFELVFLIWSGGILLSIILAILGIFYPLIIGAYLLLSVFAIWRAQKKSCALKNKSCPLAGKITIKKISFIEKTLLTGLIIFAIFLSAFTVPTVFGGRDEGSLSNSALLINRDHGLAHQSKLINTFGVIYGEGKALNFPGFLYKKSTNDTFILKSQFLPGYSSYLANFAYPTNPSLLKFANLLPLVILLLAFYSIIKHLTKSIKFSVLGVVLLASLLPTGIFYKTTLTEIFFASLIWPSLYFLIKYLKLLKNKKDAKLNLYYWFIFIPLLPTVFTRIEAFGIIFSLLLILILKSYKQLQKPNYQTPLLLISLLTIISLFIFDDYFIIVIKGFLNSFLPTELAPTINPEHTTSLSFIPKIWRNFYLPKLFYTYNLIPLFLFATLGIFKLIKEKSWDLMTPLFLLGITGIYLVDANISIDHPWLLRRFIFSIFPLAILYTIIFFQRYPSGRAFWQTFIVSILTVSSLLIFIPFALFKSNINLNKQVAVLNKEFTKNDLVLVSQKVSGSGWSLVSEPLRNIYNKQAIYFFNPEDYHKINLNKFNKVYLIASDKEIDLYNKKLSLNKVKNYTIKNQLIEPSKNPLLLPRFIITETHGSLYLIN
jgi:hypothetical protein